MITTENASDMIINVNPLYFYLPNVDQYGMDTACNSLVIHIFLWVIWHKVWMLRSISRM